MGKLKDKLTSPRLSGFEKYEDRLSHNLRWALGEASQYFQDRGDLRKTLHRIAAKLDELQVTYAVAGGLALFAHGFRRFTEDVDILITKESLSRIHNELEGLGYVVPFTGSKNLRDTDTGVRIEFLIAGQFPGDGKPKPIAFPSPSAVAIEDGGIKYLNLNTLIELKLASGMTNPNRGKDLIDVQEVIKAINLPLNFSEKLHPFVQAKYIEMWNVTRSGRHRYVLLWKLESSVAPLSSIDEIIQSLRASGNAAADKLTAMKTDGITLDTEAGANADHARLITDNPDIATKYGMHDESEFLE